MVYLVLFKYALQLRWELNQWHPFSDEMKNVWSYTSTVQIFTVWYLIKIDNFTCNSLHFNSCEFHGDGKYLDYK
jgi:hypothetical protein